jgi:hypothetical protein
MKSVIAFLFLVSTASVSFASNLQDQFPQHPDPTLTPGKLCVHGQAQRYPEKIEYCNRKVSTGEKNQRFADYDSKLGYQTRSMNRMDFKIDHYIPLCAGGSNDPENLWPQHKTIYEITDPMEPLLCQRMQEGKLLQKDAVVLIMRGKNHLDEVPKIMDQLIAL